MNARYIDAPNAKEARARGALANIAEGRGSAIDAAKYLRDSGNVLAIDENAKRSESAEQSVKDFNREVHLRGPVNAVIQKHAADLLEAKTKKEKEAVKAAMIEELRLSLRPIGT